MTKPDETPRARHAASWVERARIQRRPGSPGPSRRARRMVGWLTLPVALLCTGLLMTPSYAVFNGTTSSAANNWASGSVVLQNNSGGANATTGSAMFSATGLQPGATDSKCVAVTSTGTVPSSVSMYVSSLSPTAAGSLSSYITVTVGIGTGTSTGGDCSNYTQTSVLPGANGVKLNNLPTTFAGGSTGWAPAGTTATRIFKITYTVDTTVPNTWQTTTATATFTWEAQNT